MIVVELPFPQIKKKNKIGNLGINEYRNAYYRTLNEAKSNYAQICMLKLREHRRKKMERVKVTYLMHSKTKHRRDLSNFCSVVDKFFSDALVSAGIIKDDDVTTVVAVDYRFGGYGEDKFVVVIEEVA